MTDATFVTFKLEGTLDMADLSKLVAAGDVLIGKYHDLLAANATLQAALDAANAADAADQVTVDAETAKLEAAAAEAPPNTGDVDGGVVP